MKYFINMVVILLLGATAAYGQTINYYGSVKDLDSDKPMSGVTVQVILNGAVLSSSTTGSDGKYSVKFPPGKTYKIKYVKPGYVSKFAKFEAEKVNGETMPPGGKLTPAINIDLFTERKGADFSFLKSEPIVDWYFDGDRMNFDKGNVNRTKKKISDALKTAAQTGVKNDADYNALISAADQLYQAKKYKEAVTKYEDAIKIPGKETEKYPNTQILKINDLLEKQAQKDLAYKQSHEKYFNLIKAADNLANNKDFDAAIQKYKDASALDSTQQYPKDRIAELQATQKKFEKKKQYDDLIKKGDNFLNQNSLRAARDAYQGALKLFPNEPYPQQQLDKMKEKLDSKMKEIENKKKYNVAIKTGDDLFQKEKYKEAIDKYNEALTYESGATYPTGQIQKANAKIAVLEKFHLLVQAGDKSAGIKDYSTAVDKYNSALKLFDNDSVKVKRDKVQQLLDTQNAKATSSATFDSLVAVADKAVGLEKYKEGVDNYNLALKIKSDDNVKTKRDKALQSLNAAKASKEKKSKIEALLASASQKMTDSAYAGAIKDYDSVLVLNVNQADAISGKAKAQKMLLQQQANQADQKKFDDLVAAADDAFDKKDWKDAQGKYMAAKKIIIDNKHVNDRIDEIQATLQKQLEDKNKEDNIKTLISQGKQFEKDSNWDDAIAKYQAALKIDNQREDVKKLLAGAKQSKADWQSKQDSVAEFDKLKNSGVDFMNNEDWEKAKAKFTAALAIHKDKEIYGYLNQIAEKIKADKATQEVEAKYKKKMAEGESFAADSEYNKALTSFQEALKIKKDDLPAKGRIKDMQQKLDQISNSAEQLKAYKKAMKDGKSSLENSDYSAAIKSFDDALLAKPLDSEATKLKQQASDKILALKQLEEKYQNLIKLGQNAYDMAATNDNDTIMLKKAKNKFEEAQKLKPKASLPQQKIVEIDQLLRKIKEDLAKNSAPDMDKKYQDELDLAKVAGQSKNYQAAINHLTKALSYKPKEDFPKKKIKEYQGLLDAQLQVKKIDRKYDSLVSQADDDFGSKSYEKSIVNYKKALQIKANENYPKQQIAKANAAISSNKTNSANQQYQDWIKKADVAYKSEDYKDAVSEYQSALDVKPNDNYAKKRIASAKAYLAEQAKKQSALAAKDKEYQKYVTAADALYNQNNYVGALKKYKLALTAKPNDEYANSRIKLCLDKAKQKTEQLNDKLYDQIISKADEYFKDTNYTKAISLYKRAQDLRSTDNYPQDQLDKIAALQSGKGKQKVNIADLGTPSDISIIEGAALLQQGEEQRKQMKVDAVQKRIHQNENIVSHDREKDYKGNIHFQNEVEHINHKANQAYLDHKDKHRETVNDIDRLKQDRDHQMYQKNNYKQGSLLRTQKEVQYVHDDMDSKRKDLTANHREIIEKVKKIQNDRNDQTRAETTKHNVKTEVTSQELEKVRVTNEKVAAVDKEHHQDMSVKMDQITHNLEKKGHAERNDMTSYKLQMQQNVIHAQIKDAESKAGKEAVQDQVREDMKALTSKLQRKARQETDEVQQQQLAIDSKLTARQDQYDSKKGENVVKHEHTVAQVRLLKQAKDRQAHKRNEEKGKNLQTTVDHLEQVRKIQEEAAKQQQKDLSAVDNKLKNYQISMDQAHQLKKGQEIQDHQATVNHLDKIRRNEDMTHEKKAQQVKQNYQDVKGLEARTEQDNATRTEMTKSKKQKVQEVINKLEDNKITYSPKIANTIGDLYPEGVTQENYIRKDSKGIPVKIITRRFVVVKGHGDIYIRIQTRNGVTYSKNGSPITENGWIQGTQRAGLVRHY